MKLNYQELSSVLAGLRLLQDKIEDETLNAERKLPHFDDVEPLSAEQIDQLCARLDCE